MNKKNILKSLQSLLFGLSLSALPMSLTGCNQKDFYQTEENLTEDELKYIDENLENVMLGFIKDGSNYIPVYIKDCQIDFFGVVQGKCYNLKTMEFIGKLKYCSYNNKKFYSIVNDFENEYIALQWIRFSECNPNVKVNTDVARELDKDTYQNLEEMYFVKENISDKLIKKIEIEKYNINYLEPIEKKEIIGFQISDIEVFNFETYQIETYKDYKITEYEIFEKGAQESFYSYYDIINFKNKPMSLDRTKE